MESHIDPHNLCNLWHILVTATGHINHEILPRSHLLRQLNRMIYSVAGLESRNHTLIFAHHFETFQRFIVGDCHVLGPPTVLQEGVLRPHAGVVEPCTDTVRVPRLSRRLLDEVRERPLQHAGRPRGQGGTVRPRSAVDTVSCRFHTNEGRALVVDEGMEGPDRVRSASDARHHRIRELARLLEHLRPNLLSHDGLEVPHDGGKGVRSHRRSDEVVRAPHVRDPVPHGLVDCILEGPLSGLDGHDLRAQRSHPKDVELLSFTVDGAHVHDALQAEHGTDGGGGHAVLSSARFGDDTFFADALGHERLSDGVVDFVRARVCQVLAFEPDRGATRQLGEAFGDVEGSGSTHEVLPVGRDLRDEGWVVFDLSVLLLDLPECLRECFGDELSAELSEHRRRGLRRVLRFDIRDLS
mmetsp:Transcript_47820/g.93401  ORF Transcript_47820/g.93401 Transcript_47820/m.93401 type:complete len:411 (+) Transcript_47820:97-1329(+)